MKRISINETMGKLRQHDYYKDIVRDQKLHQTISDYIVNNPAKGLMINFTGIKGLRRDIYPV